jgi:hypothetical protein
MRQAASTVGASEAARKAALLKVKYILLLVISSS